jgi:HEAT repeat protein
MRVRLAAAKILGEIGDEGAVGALEKAIKDENEIVHREAEAALERIAAKKGRNR